MVGGWMCVYIGMLTVTRLQNSFAVPRTFSGNVCEYFFMKSRYCHLGGGGVCVCVRVCLCLYYIGSDVMFAGAISYSYLLRRCLCRSRACAQANNNNNCNNRRWCVFCICLAWHNRVRFTIVCFLFLLSDFLWCWVCVCVRSHSSWHTYNWMEM